jgi:hypothetical protein
MITNGLYVYESEALDHGDGGYRTYSCSGGKWKGELTQREHTRLPIRSRRRGKSSPPDLPEPIPMRLPSSKPLRSWESEAFDTMQICGC